MISDHVLDNGVGTNGVGQANVLHICSQMPASYAEIATYTLGNKTSPTMSVVNGTVSGRSAQVASFSDGTVTGSGEATVWVLAYTTGSLLIAGGDLAEPQEVTEGNTFGMAAFQAVNIPDEAS